MSIVHRVVVGLIALTPLGAMAGAACVGKVASVYVELDTNVYFDIQPTGDCGCNNVTYPENRGFMASEANKKEQYAALLTAFSSGSDVQIWYDWSSSTGNDRCASRTAALIRR